MNELETRRGHRISLTACAVVIATSMGAGAVQTDAVQAAPVEMIERYCETSWRNAQIARQDWGDCTQEAFVRLLERVPQDKLKRAISDSASSERRELNRSIWATTQKWRRAVRRRPVLSEGKAVTDEPEAAVSQADEIDELREEAERAMAKLSDRQQEILTRYSQGDSIAEIAAALDMSPARVSDEKYKAIQKIRRA